jgi:hypothetical protein
MLGHPKCSIPASIGQRDPYVRFPIRILITYRRDFVDRIYGRVAFSTTINIENENSLDIRKYIQGELSMWKSSPRESELLLELEHEIIESAESIFLWIKLVVENLLRRSSRLETAFDTIYTFPRGRNEKLRRLYEEILIQATDNLKDEKMVIDIKLILSIVITSASPLK